MTPETINWVIEWVANVLLIPTILGAVYVLNVARKLDATLNNPTASKFSTERTDHLIEENIRVIRELTHYIQWLGEATTGTKAPPHVDNLPFNGSS